MKLFIKVQDGLPINHPIIEENFKQAFPNIDTENLPPEFANFIRVDAPAIDKFEVYEGCTYEWNGSAFTDVHHVRQMNEEEKAAKIEKIKANPPGSGAIWNEESYSWDAPKMPESGGPWIFDVASYDWVIATEPPKKGWVLNKTGTRYVPPFPPPQPYVENARYVWNEENENWDVIINE